MKNEHILPNTEVPIELRKEVYKEALRIIENGEREEHSNHLCLIVPKLLYGINLDLFLSEVLDFKVNLPPTEMFPELKGFLTRGFANGDYTDKERIKFLKSVI